MEQLTLIQIYENGQVDILAEIMVNDQFVKVENKEVVRRHLNKIMGLLLGKSVNVFYSFKSKDNE